VHAQPAAAASVAESCGHLPLALRIAGARLATLPHWSIQQLAERLADQTRRLDELRHRELGIRASISVTYDGSSEQARRLLRRLAVLDEPVFSGWVSAALLDQPVVDAQDLLDELLTANLVETAGRDQSLQDPKGGPPADSPYQPGNWRPGAVGLLGEACQQCHGRQGHDQQARLHPPGRRGRDGSG
jgi:hypothetical protein